MKKNNSNFRIKTSLEFKTDKEQIGHRRLTFGLIFGIGTVMLACICLLLLLREYDFDVDNIIGRTTETSETSEESTSEPVRMDGKTTFLLLCSDDDGEKVHHAALLDVDLGKAEMKITTVDAKKSASVNGFSGNLSQQLAHGGMTQAVAAAESMTNAKISRYIRATDTSFKGVVKVFGGVPCTIDSRISYSVDGVGYIIDKGTQTLTADMSYKYMYYLSQQNENKPEKMSEFLADMLVTFMTEENFNRVDTIYKKLVNILDTDISAYDFANNKASLGYLIEKTQGQKATVA
ncbi:MAG: LCP family protein [Acutalibacteraceae bacterium]